MEIEQSSKLLPPRLGEEEERTLNLKKFLFVSQRHDRVEGGGFFRWPKAEKNADGA